MKYSVALCCLLVSLAAVAEAKQKDARVAKTRETAREKSVPSVPSPKVDDQRSVPAQTTPRTLVIGTVSQWRAHAEERYPALKTAGSAFSIAFEDAYKVTQTEDPGFLLANDWPLRLAHIVAHTLAERVSVPLAVAGR